LPWRTGRANGLEQQQNSSQQPEHAQQPQSPQQLEHSGVHVPVPLQQEQQACAEVTLPAATSPVLTPQQQQVQSTFLSLAGEGTPVPLQHLQQA
jgi:hypothetical protein